ncbi:DUF3471 domain-containing protein [uncultured Winogradskyella sp.]|uniref:DUF3471 domain-containing protein n=1 Tax=uncultured Winogradskyella sp. TaxID=395353 RepID=UPI002616057A|nr:DUF3471 domain-containing protein [uncultured Winogradskyella sp.]
MNQSKSIKILLLCTIGLIITSGIAYAQVDKTSELYKTLKTNDSLLFSVGFNTCDISQFERFLAEDLEFYHDKSGIEKGKTVFIKGVKSGLCKPNNTEKINRYLVEESLEVFPLYNNGKLYGTIQKGVHYFSQVKDLKFDDSDNSAQFSHLWLLTNGKWEIKRVFSYNHIAKEIKKELKSVVIPQQILSSYTGNYKAPKTGNVTIKLSGNNLSLKAGEMEAIIVAISQNTFAHSEASLIFEFTKNENGNISRMVVKENGKIVETAIKQ